MNLFNNSKHSVKGFLTLLSLTFIFTLFSFSAKVEGEEENPIDSSEFSINIKQIDSANEALLKLFNLKLVEIEEQRIKDSLQKLALVEQLNSLKTTDNLKKDELQKQLEELNNAELLRISEKKEKIDSLRMTVKGFPVFGTFQDTLFLIYNSLGSFSAYDRAVVITERIDKLKDNYPYDSTMLTLVESENTFDIVFGERIILSITENDEIWCNSPKLEIAKKYKKLIDNDIIKYQTETSLSQLVIEFSLAGLVIIILFVIIIFINKGFHKISKKISRKEKFKYAGFKIKNYTVLNTKGQVDSAILLLTIVRWVIILMLIYIALPIIFGFFPWTKNYATILIGFILTPLTKIVDSIVDYFPNLITIIVINIVFKYILKLVKYFKIEIARERIIISGFHPDWANPTFQIIKILLIAFMLIVIFPYLPGSNSPVFQGVSVFLGVLFTFGSSGSLTNVMSGLVLTYMRAFRVGDRVKIGDIMGDIIEKSILVTRIRTPKNEIISIPNSNVMSSHTINYSSDAPEKGLIVHSTVTIGYDVPWRKVHEVLIDAANKTELILEEPEPFVLQTSLDDFYVSYQVNAYTKDPNKQALIYSSLHQNIQDCCKEANIEIMSPHYRAERDGGAITIPPDYTEKKKENE